MGAIKNWAEKFQPKEKRKLFINSGLLCGAAASFFLSVTGDSSAILGAIILCTWLLIYAAIFIAIVKKNKGKGFWREFAIESLIYLACVVVGVIIGWISMVLLAIVIAIAFAMMLLGGSGSLFGLLGTGSNSNSGYNHACCATCRRFSNGQCHDNPGKIIGDPAAVKCDSYSL